MYMYTYHIIYIYIIYKSICIKHCTICIYIYICVCTIKYISSTNLGLAATPWPSETCSACGSRGDWSKSPAAWLDRRDPDFWLTHQHVMDDLMDG